MKNTYNLLKKLFIAVSFALLAIILNINSVVAINGSGVYGGGPFYNNRDVTIPELRQSGFTWVCVWTIHVMNSNGDLNYNAEFPIVTNGVWVGDATYPEFSSDMDMLKTAPTSIEWIEAGLAGWGSGSFGLIKDLVNSDGTGPNSKLYKSFAALKAAVPAIDAISFDDEDYYDEPTTTQFAVMLADLGFKVSICPYTQVSHWQNVVTNVNNQRPGTIEDVHLQCYAGGAGNNPCTWDGYFASEINVMPGVEDGGGIASSMSSWNSQCGITGGWLWLYDDFDGNLSTVQSYADAINNNITQVTTNPPGQASIVSPANGATNVSTAPSLNWNAGSDATSHDVYFGTDVTPDAGESKGNQTGTSYNPGALATSTTYYWRIDEVNSNGTTTGVVWSFTTEATITTTVDHTDPVGTGTITARAQINTNEGASKAFDNKYTSGDFTKWLDNGGVPSSSNPSWIQIQLPDAVIVNSLSIVSANDDFGRDPEDFNLQGSNNGTSWTTLNSWSGQTWASRYTKKELSFSNTVAYSYFKLNITKNDDGISMTQLAEIELVGPTGSIPTPPVAEFSANLTSVIEGGSVNFTDNSTNTPTSWAWTFSGGIPASSAAQNPTVTYNTAGTYNVTLVATNADGNDTETKTGYIAVTAAPNDPPVAQFTASATSINVGGSVSFTDNSTNTPTSWAWTFIGGTPASSTVQNPTVSYNTAGTYNVTLVATNTYGNDTETKTGYITVSAVSVSYCASQGNNVGYEWIAGVKFGSFTKTSNAAMYSDFTSETISVSTGSTAVELTPGFGSSSYSEVWRVWIDLNQDGDFEDTDEEVFSPSGSSSTVTGNLDIPSSADGITTRLRVSMRYNSAPSSCGSFDYGEVEDYTVAISDVQAPTIALNVNELIVENEITCYPNPFTDKLTISSLKEIALVTICSVDGKVLQMNMCFGETIEMDMSEFKAGIYLIKVVNQDGTYAINRIIKR